MPILTKSQYQEALTTHDWTFEFSDDHKVWRKGREAQAELLYAARVFDRGFELWNAAAPAAEFRRTVISTKEA